MRIALIGGHGVGKSSVAAPIAKHLGLPLIPEQARKVAEEWGYTPATIPTEMLKAFQWEILVEQVTAEAIHHQGFVSDRSVIDNMAYWLSMIPRLEIPWQETERYKSAALTRIPHYDLLILIPPMFPLPTDDPARHPDPAYQREIHETVCGLVDDWGAMVCPELPSRVYRVRSDGIDNRINEILDAVNRMRARA